MPVYNENRGQGLMVPSGVTPSAIQACVWAMRLLRCGALTG